MSGLFTVICFSFYLGRQIVWLWSLLIIVHTLYVQFNHQTIECWSLIFLKTHTHACARTNSHKQPLCVFFPWAWGKLYSCDIIIAHKFMCAIQFSNHVILISDLFTLYIYIYNHGCPCNILCVNACQVYVGTLRIVGISRL